MSSQKVAADKITVQVNAQVLAYTLSPTPLFSAIPSFHFSQLVPVKGVSHECSSKQHTHRAHRVSGKGVNVGVALFRDIWDFADSRVGRRKKTLFSSPRGKK